MPVSTGLARASLRLLWPALAVHQTLAPFRHNVLLNGLAGPWAWLAVSLQPPPQGCLEGCN